MSYPVEVVERRSAYEKHYEVGPGEFEVHSFRVPVHFERDGVWHDIAPVWDGPVLRGMPYDARLKAGLVGTEDLHVELSGRPLVDGHRIWYHGIAPDTSAVLIAGAYRLQLHLILWGPNAPREWRFYMAAPDDREIGGRDNIERYVTRDGPEQHYELDVTHEVDGNTVVKRWSGRVKSIDPVTRQMRWTDDVVYPVRIV